MCVIKIFQLKHSFRFKYWEHSSWMHVNHILQWNCMSSYGWPLLASHWPVIVMASGSGGFVHYFSEWKLATLRSLEVFGVSEQQLLSRRSSRVELSVADDPRTAPIWWERFSRSLKQWSKGSACLANQFKDSLTRRSRREGEQRGNRRGGLNRARGC